MKQKTIDISEKYKFKYKKSKNLSVDFQRFIDQLEQNNLIDNIDTFSKKINLNQKLSQEQIKQILIRFKFEKIKENVYQQQKQTLTVKHGRTLYQLIRLISHHSFMKGLNHNTNIKKEALINKRTFFGLFEY